MAVVKRFEIYLVNLDEPPGKAAKNTRPAVVISPNEMNRNLSYVIVAPISARTVDSPTRVTISLLNSDRSIVLDQIRTVDKERLVKVIGQADKNTCKRLLERLQEMFAE